MTIQEDELSTEIFLPRIVICRECKQPFCLTPPERRWYLEMRYSEPTHCPDCRRDRREARDGDHNG